MKYETRFHPERVAESVFIAPTATVLGKVNIGEHSSVWFGAVVRGDTELIEIGESTNIQDLSLLHADAGVPCRIGNRVTVGHAAIVHGAIVEDETMIGMRAVVLNGATIGSHSIIAAGAVVPEGMQIPPRSLVMGMPAKVIRSTNDEHLERIRYAADHYVEAAVAFREY